MKKKKRARRHRQRELLLLYSCAIWDFAAIPILFPDMPPKREDLLLVADDFYSNELECNSFNLWRSIGFPVICLPSFARFYQQVYNITELLVVDVKINRCYFEISNFSFNNYLFFFLLFELNESNFFNKMDYNEK